MAVSDYSTTPDENVSISGINIAEGCAPSGINNAIRQMMADIKTKTASMDSTASTNAEAISANASAISANASAISAEETRAKAAEATYLPLSGGTISGDIILNGIRLVDADCFKSVVHDFSYAPNTTISTGGYTYTGSLTINQFSGWDPLFASCLSSGSNLTYCYNCTLTSDNSTVTLQFKNSNSKTQVTAKIAVVYVRRV